MEDRREKMMTNVKFSKGAFSARNATATAALLLPLSILILLFAGYHGAKISTANGDIGSRTFVTETISRSYELIPRNRKGSIEYYQCFVTEGAEQCVAVGDINSGRKVGDSMKTIRIWGNNRYALDSPVLGNLTMCLAGVVISIITALICAGILIFPQSLMFEHLDDSRPIKLFDNSLS